MVAGAVDLTASFVLADAGAVDGVLPSVLAGSACFGAVGAGTFAASTGFAASVGLLAVVGALVAGLAASTGLVTEGAAGCAAGALS